MTSKTQLRALVADLANDLQEQVAKIESQPVMTTRNHYGRYLNIMLSVSKGDKKVAKLLAAALLQAGANRAGVADAYRVGLLGE